MFSLRNIRLIKDQKKDIMNDPTSDKYAPAASGMSSDNGNYEVIKELAPNVFLVRRKLDGSQFLGVDRAAHGVQTAYGGQAIRLWKDDKMSRAVGNILNHENL